MWRQAVVFSVLVSGAFAALALAKLDDKPDKYSNVSGCYIPEVGGVVPFGQTAPAKHSCKEYRCAKDYERQGLIVTAKTCGSMAALPPCYLTEDLSKPYPACCPVGVCPDTATKATTTDAD